MNPREEGFLLLTGKLGDPDRPVLTVAQFRNLALSARQLSVSDPDRQIAVPDLISLGYSRRESERILMLLSHKDKLGIYVRQGEERGCFPLTRVSEQYPFLLRKRLQLDAPGCLWAMGDGEILNHPALSLVGSRELREENAVFAREVGKQAALQGYTLISGNARGADREAQESCLYWGGRVISVVSDQLWKCKPRNNILYLSEEGYDLPFSAQRALSRNRVIHAMTTGGVFVAQSALAKGGTWNGTVYNLRHNLSPVYCFRDGSPAQQALCDRGAIPVETEQLADIYELNTHTPSLF